MDLVSYVILNKITYKELTELKKDVEYFGLAIKKSAEYIGHGIIENTELAEHETGVHNLKKSTKSVFNKVKETL